MGLMKIEKEKKCKNKKNKEEKITERWFISLNYFSPNKKNDDEFNVISQWF